MNRMKEIAKLYNVELGEKFNLKDHKGEGSLYNPYYFSENGLVDKDEHSRPILMMALLKGELELEKIPFKPVYEKRYVYVSDDGNAHYDTWFDYDIDFYRYNAGNCFRKREDVTEEIKERILKEMKEKYGKTN